MCFSFFSSASHYSWMEQSKSRRSRGTERNGKIGGSMTRRGRRGTRSRSLSPKCGGTFEIYFKKTDFLMWNVPSAAFRERMSSWWIRQIFFCDFFFHRFFHISVTIYINFRWKKNDRWNVRNDKKKKDFFCSFLPDDSKSVPEEAISGNRNQFPNHKFESQARDDSRKSDRIRNRLRKVFSAGGTRRISMPLKIAMGSSTKNTKFFFVKNVETNTHTHTCVCHVGGKMKSQKRSRKKELTEPTPEKTVFRSVISKIASFFLPTRQSSCDSLARSTETS